jgi:hypothetical protein
MYSVSIRNIEKTAVPRMKPATFAPVTVRVRRMTRLCDRVDERGEAAGDENGAGSVERPHAGVATLLEETRGQDERHRAHGHVDEEDPRPAE